VLAQLPKVVSFSIVMIGGVLKKKKKEKKTFVLEHIHQLLTTLFWYYPS
jgi:hypothetical protein